MKYILNVKIRFPLLLFVNFSKKNLTTHIKVFNAGKTALIHDDTNVENCQPM